jgi:hypothetical protein
MYKISSDSQAPVEPRNSSDPPAVEPQQARLCVTTFAIPDRSVPVHELHLPLPPHPYVDRVQSHRLPLSIKTLSARVLPINPALPLSSNGP